MTDIRPAQYFTLDDGRLVTVSIQASTTHYCSPKVDALELCEYDSVEMAMWGTKDQRGTLWLLPGDISDALKDLDERWDQAGNTIVGSFVPHESVQRIIDELRRLGHQND